MNIEVSKNVLDGLKQLENESIDSKTLILNTVQTCLGYGKITHFGSGSIILMKKFLINRKYYPEK